MAEESNDGNRKKKKKKNSGTKTPSSKLTENGHFSGESSENETESSESDKSLNDFVLTIEEDKSNYHLAEEKEITLYIKPMVGYKGKPLDVTVTESYTIGELKMALELQHGFDTRFQVFVFGDKQLQDDKSLQFYGLKDKCTVFIVPKMKSGPLEYKVDTSKYKQIFEDLESDVNNAVSKVNEAPGIPPKSGDIFHLTIGPNGEMRLIRLTNVFEESTDGDKDGQLASDEDQNEIKLETWDMKGENQNTKKTMANLQRRMKDVKERKIKQRLNQAAEERKKLAKIVKKVDKTQIFGENAKQTKPKKDRKDKENEKSPISGADISLGPSDDNLKEKEIIISLKEGSSECYQPIHVGIRKNPPPLSNVISEIKAKKKSLAICQKSLNDSNEPDFTDVLLWTWSFSSENDSRNTLDEPVYKMEENLSNFKAKPEKSRQTQTSDLSKINEGGNVPKIVMTENDNNVEGNSNFKKILDQSSREDIDPRDNNVKKEKHQDDPNSDDSQ